MPSLINSDDGVVSGSSGLKTTGGNDGLLNIQTNGTTALAIDASQNATFAGTIFGLNVVTGTVSVTGGTTLTSSAFGKLHQCTGTSADYTVTLPAVSGNAGKVIAFQMSTALTKLVTIDGNASETIDGATTRVMWAGETAVLYCDGTAWTKIGGKTIPMVAGQTVSGTQSIATGTSTKKTLGTATGYTNCPSAMNDTANSRIVVLRAGNYLLQGCTRISNITTTTNQETLLYVSGSEYAITSRYATTGDFSSMICDINYAAAANAVIELYARQYSGVNQTYLNNIMNYLFVTEIPQW